LLRSLKKIPPLAALLSVAVGIYNAWFLNFGVRTAGDWGYFVKAASDTLRRHYFSVWLSDTQFGRVLIDAGQAPTYAAYGWLSYYLHTDYALNERIVHLWPSVIIAIAGAYALVHYIFRDKLAAVLGAIVYAANTYYLALLTGGLTLAVAYAIAPLVVLFYMKAINSQKLTDGIICALLLAVCSAYEPRIAYIVVFVMLALAAVHFFCVWQPKNQKIISMKTLRMLLIYGGPLILFGLLNTYWIIGLMHASGGSSQAISSSLFGNEFFTMPEALTLFHPYWTGGQIQPFFIHPIPLYFWFIPMAAIAGLIVSKRSPVILFFALLGAAGMLLTKQSDVPFVGLYHWLFTHVPGFNAFREASKFYTLTALSYAVLLPALYWHVKTQYKRKWLTVGCFTALSLLFLPNLIPIATNTIGGTFSSRSMPAQYTKLNKFLDTGDYGRVLWVPEKSRWGFTSANHPAVNATSLLDTWRDLSDSYPSNNNATSTDEIDALLQQNYMPSLLADADIQYVIVPMRDTNNNDNFYRSYNDDPAMFASALASSGYLKRVNIPISGFYVYRTLQPPKPYFSSTTQLYTVTSDAQLPNAYSLWQQSLNSKGDFNFTLGNTTTGYSTDITDLFSNLGSSSLRSSTLPITKTSSLKRTDYYFSPNYTDASYTASPRSISFQVNGLQNPGSSTKQKTMTTVVPLNPAADYVVHNGADIAPVTRNLTPVYLGSPHTDTELYMVSSTDLVKPPTIEGSLWQENVNNCTPYGSDDPNIRMVSTMDDILNKPVLALTADDHTACSGPPAVSVQAGETYLLRFMYRGYNAQFAGYRLVYNSPTGQTITNDIPIADNVWHTYQTLLTVPSGATHLAVELLGRPSNQIKDATATSYTNLSLVHLSKTATIQTSADAPQHTNIATPSLYGIPYKGYTYHNLISNGSFENGPWKRRVGDCDAFDNNAAIGMSLVKRQTPDGHYALQLEAARHIACTNQSNIKVKGGATYLFQFEYQSPNAQDAGYAITFDDKNSTRLSRQVPIPDTNWHTYRQTITVPSDAHALSFAIFAYSEDQSTYFVNRYDNFVLQQVPDIENRFYAVSNPTVAMASPRSIHYQDINSTFKKVAITGASKPFLLVMSEQYHPDWHIVLGNAADTRTSTYIPWATQLELPSQDHLEINAFENGWYIDPRLICTAHPSTCTQGTDGSYDLSLGIQFSGQRWFNLGLLISGTTALACVSTLIGLLTRHGITTRKRRAQHDTKRAT
jgi:hypothetical protein